MTDQQAAKVVPLKSRQRSEKPVALTEARVRDAEPRRRLYYLRDATVPGLTVRVTPNGAKAYILRSRIGAGRGAPRIDYKLGTPAKTTLSDARQQARETLVLLRKGIDPRIATPGETRTQEVLKRYEQNLEARQVVKRREVMSTLRTNLAPFRHTAIADLTRLNLVGIIDGLEASGRSGAAQYFRAKVAAFLNFAADKGYIPVSPLAGFRRERLTRAQRAKRPQRAYATRESLSGLLEAFWSLSDPMFRDFLRFALLTGQRRMEIALMRWADLDLKNPEGPRWRIPGPVRKTGEDHEVPLGPLSVQLLEAQPRHAGTDLVFPSRRQLKPIGGWGNRIEPVRKALGDDDFTMHALRRSYRSGLTELGVDFDTAELQIGHKRRGLAGVYDKSKVWEKRIAAQAAWESMIGSIERELPCGAPGHRILSRKDMISNQTQTGRPQPPRYCS